MLSQVSEKITRQLKLFRNLAACSQNEIKYCYHDAGLGDAVIYRSFFILLLRIFPGIKIITNQGAIDYLKFYLPAHCLLDVRNTIVKENETVLNLSPYKRCFVSTHKLSRDLSFRLMARAFMRLLHISIFNEYILKEFLFQRIIFFSRVPGCFWIDRLIVFPDASTVKKSLDAQTVHKIRKWFHGKEMLVVSNRDVIQNSASTGGAIVQDYQPLHNYIEKHPEMVISTDSWPSHFFDNDKCLVVTLTRTREFRTFYRRGNVYISLRAFKKILAK